MKAPVEYKGIPRIRDFRYPYAYLRCINENRRDMNSLLRAMVDVRATFEEEKLKALGKGGRIDKERLVEGRKGLQLVRRSQQICTQLGLVSMLSGMASLTEEGRHVVERGLQDIDARAVLVRKFFQTYRVCRDIFFAIRSHVEGKVFLPLARSKKTFVKTASRCGITSDQWNFELVRDLSTELELLNWRPEASHGMRMHVVYLITNIVKLSELSRGLRSADRKGFAQTCVERFKRDLELDSAIPDPELRKRAEEHNYLDIVLKDDVIFLKSIEPTQDEVEDSLWREYLRMTDYRAMRPAFYSELRELVCEKVRISNRRFDDYLKPMISQPSKYETKVYAGGGALPYSPGVVMRKYLPPKTGTDEYITYIKLDREEA